MTEKRSVRWVAEFLPLDGVDHDPWRMALMSKLVWFAVITTDPHKWTYQTAAELRGHVNADHMTERAIRKKLTQLEDSGLIESEEGWQRRKRFRPNLLHPVVGAIYERFRGASHVVAARPENSPIRNHGSDTEATEINAVSAYVGTTVPSFGTTVPTEEVKRNHSSDGRNHSSDARTERTTERTTTTTRAREEPKTNRWRGFDDWLLEKFEVHNLQLTIPESMSLTSVLSTYADRETVERYVLSTLVNMQAKSANHVVRVLQKRQRFDHFKADDLPPPDPNKAHIVMATDDQDRMRRLAELYGGVE